MRRKAVPRAGIAAPSDCVVGTCCAPAFFTRSCKPRTYHGLHASCGGWSRRRNLLPANDCSILTHRRGRRRQQQPRRSMRDTTISSALDFEGRPGEQGVASSAPSNRSRFILQQMTQLPSVALLPASMALASFYHLCVAAEGDSERGVSTECRPDRWRAARRAAALIARPSMMPGC